MRTPPRPTLILDSFSLAWAGDGCTVLRCVVAVVHGVLHQNRLSSFLYEDQQPVVEVGRRNKNMMELGVHV